MRSERLTLPVADPKVDHVTAVLHHPDGFPPGADRAGSPPGPPVLLTHGAGGDLDADGLVALAEVLAAAGSVVVRANLPYRESGRRAAPRAESSVGPFVEVWRAAERLLTDRGLRGHTGWVVGGKSYGGRVASLASATHPDTTPDHPPVAGLLFYGYPLHPPGKPDRLRVAHWPQVPVPCLFLQGERDPFCDLGLLDQHLTKLPRRASLEVVTGGDHSLRVTGANSPDGRPRNPVRVIDDLSDVIVRWLGSL